MSGIIPTKKISQLDTASDINGTELFAVIKNLITKKITISMIKDYIKNSNELLKTESNRSNILGFDGTSPFGGSQVIAAPKFSTNGDAQSTTVVAKKLTTNNTPTALELSSSQLLIIPNNTTWLFTALIVGRNIDTAGDSAAFKVEGCIDNNSNTVALVGSPTVTVIARDSASWNASVSADNTNKCLTLNVIGENSKNIKWVGRITIVEITG